MLINSESSFKKDDVLALKNILGEEIICTFVEEDSTHYTIKNVFAIAMTQQGTGFVPAVMFGDMSGQQKVLKTQFLWAVPAAEQVVPAYTTQVSGIVVPQKDTKIIT